MIESHKYFKTIFVSKNCVNLLHLHYWQNWVPKIHAPPMGNPGSTTALGIVVISQLLITML